MQDTVIDKPLLSLKTKPPKQEANGPEAPAPEPVKPEPPKSEAKPAKPSKPQAPKPKLEKPKPYEPAEFMFSTAIREDKKVTVIMTGGETIVASPISFGHYSFELMADTGERFVVFKHSISMLCPPPKNSTYEYGKLGFPKRSCSDHAQGK